MLGIIFYNSIILIPPLLHILQTLNNIFAIFDPALYKI